MATSVSLRQRSYQAEIMDEGSYSESEFFECLRQLELINRLTSGHAPTLGALAEFYRRHRAAGRTEPMRVLDIGFGHGDTLRAVAEWAERNEIPLELTGLDLNPLAERAARLATPERLGISFITGDVFEHRPARPYHVVMNALMMHHLDDAQTVKLLRWMRANSSLGFFINDLHRHPLAYIFIKWATRLFGFNRLIQHDAPLSVARSFTAQDWLQYATLANLEFERVSIRWHWAFRYGVRYDAVL